MSKKEIKGQELGSSLFSDRERMELWFSANWKKCIIVAAAVITGAAVVAAWYVVDQKKDAEFRMELNTVAVDKLADVIAKEPEHPAVHAARLRLANGLIAKGDVKGAKVEFDKLASSPEAAAALQECGKIGAADGMLYLGDTKGALAGYKALAMDTAVSLPTRAEAGYHAATLLLDAGDKAGAEEVLKSVLSGKDSAAGMDYFMMLCESLSKNINNYKAPVKK